MQRKDLRRLPRNIWVMSAAPLLNDISSEMPLNLMPFFLAIVLGVRTSVIGLTEGVAETTASLLKVVFGALSDRLGKRKVWILTLGVYHALRGKVPARGQSCDQAPPLFLARS